MKSSLQAKGFVAALVVSLISRVLFDHLFSYLSHDSAIVDNLAATAQYALLYFLCVLLLRNAGITPNVFFGRTPTFTIAFQSIVFATLLLAFSYGENFLETYVTAQVSPAVAYGFWGFHAQHYVLELTGASYLILIIAQFVVAPLVEEFLFRGILQRAWARYYGLKKSVVFVALLFTFLHFGRHYYITTFAFSVVLSILYVRFRSIWINVGVHAIFNAVAFVIEFKVGFHWERSITQVAEVRFWLPELAMLSISLPLLTFFIYKSWRELDYPSASFTDGELLSISRVN